MSVKEIRQNLHFLAVETKRQVDDAFEALMTRNAALGRRVEERDDYVDTLKYNIAKLCFAPTMQLPDRPDSEAMAEAAADANKAMYVIAASLEHIADFAVNQVRQLPFLEENPYTLEDFHIDRFYKTTTTALKRVVTAVQKSRTGSMQTICKAEARLDALYDKELKRIVAMMNQPERKNSGSLITFMLLTKSYEKMGDEILNIGEALMHLGGQDRLKYRQWQTFHNVVDAMSNGESSETYRFNDIAGTRSGHRIGSVKMDDRSGIFKEGFRRKIDEELERINKWNSRFPGLVPEILSVKSKGDRAAVVMEYLDGKLYQDIFVNEDNQRVAGAFDALNAALLHIWGTTKRRVAAPCRSLDQVRGRLDAVYANHPNIAGLWNQRCAIGDRKYPTLPAMLKRLDPWAEKWQSPVRVWIHGDFNTNNILFDPALGQVHYIDVHRSTPGDPAEDVGTFVLSNVRLPVHDPFMRARLFAINRAMIDLCRGFARQHDDPHVERRLALAIARNFITSSRFEVERRRAEEYYLRGCGLLEDVLRNARRKQYTLDVSWIAL